MPNDHDDFRRLADEIEFGPEVGDISEYTRRELRAHQERLVTFIDVLGFASLVESAATDDAVAKQLIEALRDISLRKPNQIDDGQMLSDYRVSCFSDCIAISLPFYTESDLDWSISEAISITINMMEFGLAIRGGMALGKLYHTPRVIVGQGLVNAYKIESKRGSPPRVVVGHEVVCAGFGLGSDTSIDQIFKWDEAGRQDCIDKGTGYESFLDMLRLDPIDNKFFVDHLSVAARSIIDEETTESDEHLMRVRQSIIESLGAIQDECIRGKWLWYRDYFNKVIDEFGNGLPLGTMSIDRIPD